VAVRPNHPWGYYSGQVEARWENDGRHMTLLSELRYIDPDGIVWTAPAFCAQSNRAIARPADLKPVIAMTSFAPLGAEDLGRRPREKGARLGITLRT